MPGASLVSLSGTVEPLVSRPRVPFDVIEMKSSPSGVVNRIWKWASVPNGNFFSTCMSTAAW